MGKAERTLYLHTSFHLTIFFLLFFFRSEWNHKNVAIRSRQIDVREFIFRIIKIAIKVRIVLAAHESIQFNWGQHAELLLIFQIIDRLMVVTNLQSKGVAENLNSTSRCVHMNNIICIECSGSWDFRGLKRYYIDAYTWRKGCYALQAKIRRPTNVHFDLR